MDLFLQFWGGICYLASKILLVWSLDSKHRKVLQIAGWFMNLLGVPAWVMIFAADGRWMAMAVEIATTPSLVLGIARSGDSPTQSGLLDKVAKVVTYGTLTAGVIYSVYRNEGITSVLQGLELGVIAGTLMAIYLLANKDRKGWLCFMFMNLCVATIQVITGKNQLLVYQQSASLILCGIGYIRAKRKPA